MILKYKDIDIYYTDHGSGDVYILLHGFLENSSIWNPFIEELSKTNRIICIDLLGHGNTGCLGYIHTMEMMAEAVLYVVNYLKIECFELIGHSMGGYVSLAVLEEYPYLVNGVFLVNSSASEDSPERKTNRDRAIEAVKHDHKSFIRIAIANLFNPENKSIHSRAIKKITNEALKTPLQGIIAALEGMKVRKDRTGTLSNFEGKKYMIISEKDPVFNLETILNEAIETKVEVSKFEDGHMSFIEEKEKFLQIAMHFIEK